MSAPHAGAPETIKVVALLDLAREAAGELLGAYDRLPASAHPYADRPAHPADCCCDCCLAAGCSYGDLADEARALEWSLVRFHAMIDSHVTDWPSAELVKHLRSLSLVQTAAGGRRRNLPEESRLLRSLQLAVETLSEAVALHDSSCDCDLCGDLWGVHYNLQGPLSLLGGEFGPLDGDEPAIADVALVVN
jgi:hypothetical protein